MYQNLYRHNPERLYETRPKGVHMRPSTRVRGRRPTILEVNRVVGVRNTISRTIEPIKRELYEDPDVMCMQEEFDQEIAGERKRLRLSLSMRGLVGQRNSDKKRTRPSIKTKPGYNKDIERRRHYRRREKAEVRRLQRVTDSFGEREGAASEVA